MTTRRGFTLIEVLVVVAILGILVAISAANFLNAIQRARQKRTMGDVQTLALGIESFTTDFNRNPAAAGYALPSGLALPTATLETVSRKLTPAHIKVVPLRDGWNSWFTCETDPSLTHYAIRPNGRRRFKGSRASAPSLQSPSPTKGGWGRTGRPTIIVALRSFVTPF